jgi:hypothetical protein
MLRLCPQRGCDALHDVHDEDVGRQFPCTKCGALLEVERGGLRIVVPAVLPTERPAGPAGRPTASPAQESQPMPTGVEEGGVKAVLFSLLFALGAVLVVVFLFLPLVDQARVLHESAEIDKGERKLRVAEGRLEDRPAGPRDKDKVVVPPEKDKGKEGETDRERERLAERRKAWEKQKRELQEKVEDLRADARQSALAYTWGMMAGFLCLAVGSVGFLGPQLGRARRVVGGVVLCVMIVLIFFAYLMGSLSTRPFSLPP